jgi:hypothetical protein
VLIYWELSLGVQLGACRLEASHEDSGIRDLLAVPETSKIAWRVA